MQVRRPPVESVDDHRSRVVLTERAAQRIGLRTAPVVAGSAIGSAGAAGTTVPYATVPCAAVLVDAEGATWAPTPGKAARTPQRRP